MTIGSSMMNLFGMKIRSLIVTPLIKLMELLDKLGYKEQSDWLGHKIAEFIAGSKNE